jgi:hypothetical protein
LSSQRIDGKDALFNAAKSKDQNKAEAINPLVQNGQKLIPSVTRVFGKSRDMYVYLQAYQQSAGKKRESERCNSQNWSVIIGHTEVEIPRSADSARCSHIYNVLNH